MTDIKPNIPQISLFAQVFDPSGAYIAILFYSQAFNPEPPVVEVGIAPHIRKLLLRLADGFTCAQLERLTFDPRAMLAAHDGSLFRSVVLTFREPAYCTTGTSSGSMSGVADARSGSSTSTTMSCSPEAKYAFYSRNLAPWLGVDEDPVTGAGHTLLAPFWTARGVVPTVLLTSGSGGGGDKPLYFPARQCSRRGGNLLVACEGAERVRIVGCCRLVLEGKFYL